MASDHFYIKFWGVRGSYPVADMDKVVYGGNTSCVEVVAGPHRVIIDAGTGIIKLGNEIINDYLENRKKGDQLHINLLFTHTHYDHTLGFGFFAPAFSSSTVVNILGPKLFEHSLEEVLEMSMMPPFFPIQLKDMASMKSIQNIKDTEVVVFHSPTEAPVIRPKLGNFDEFGDDALYLTNYRTYAHPQGGNIVYKFSYRGRTFVHATDTEGYIGGDARLIKFAKGADLLSHDAQYDDEEYASGRVQGFGHSTPTMAAEIARRAEVKQLGLIHHDPRHSDDKVEELEAIAKKIFPETVAIREYQRFELL